MKKTPLLLLALSLIAACSSGKKEDIVNTVPKDGTIETSVKVEHLNDSTDILVTTHKVWKNALIMKNIVAKDTVPALGTIMADDENGNKKVVKKDYDIYITVQ